MEEQVIGWTGEGTNERTDWKNWNYRTLPLKQGFNYK